MYARQADQEPEDGSIKYFQMPDWGALLSDLWRDKKIRQLFSQGQHGYLNNSDVSSAWRCLTLPLWILKSRQC
jgi:hypothetical protein